MTLTRNSSTQGTNANIQVDNLVYTYDTANPNQLKTVTDGTGSNYTGYGFKVYPGTSAGNYTYDVNGNLTADPYKGLTINYNVLNRTDKITVTTSTGRYINYTYDAGGTLIRKQAYDNNVLGTTTDYVDGLVYLNGVISYFAMPEGRVRNIGSGTTVTLKQEFIVTDQQGNARISFEDNGSQVAVVRQETSYYGFGLSLANSPLAPLTDNNKNLYNGGSEWQNDYGNLPDLQQTYYRNYDPALGRWIAVDPVAESAESMTVYQYAGNNPIMMNDPLGDLSQAQFDFVLDQLKNGIDGNYFLKDGQDGGGGSGGSLYTRLSDWEAIGAVADRIDNGSIRGGWGATAAGSFQTAFNNFTNGITATERSDVYHQVPLPEATVTETRNNSDWLIDRLNNANQEGPGYIPAGGTTGNWYDLGSKVNAVFGAIAPFLKSSIAYLRSGAPYIKYYASGWKGGSRALIRTVETARIAGWAGFAAGEIMDIGAYLSSDPDIHISGTKALVNLGFGLLGNLGGEYGAAASVIYFGVDAFYPGGWSGVGKDLSAFGQQIHDTTMQGLGQYNNIYQWVPHQ